MTVIKAIEFPNKTFSCKKELIKALKSNENKIVDLKKSAIKDSEGCNYLLTTKDNEAVKGISGMKDGFIYAIINTTNIMDSHNDVHLPKLWNQSIKEQKGKVFYITDHDLKVNSVIAFPKDVSMSVKTMAWSDLGADFEGETQALVFEVDTDSIKHDGVLKIIQEKIDIEHSVRMQYVTIKLAINSEEKEDKAYKKEWDKNINKIANKDDAIERGYYWAIYEAKVFKEGSMVLAGSNSVTPLLRSENNEESNKIAPNESGDSAPDDEKKKKRVRFA